MHRSVIFKNNFIHRQSKFLMNSIVAFFLKINLTIVSVKKKNKFESFILLHNKFSYFPVKFEKKVNYENKTFFFAVFVMYKVYFRITNFLWLFCCLWSWCSCCSNWPRALFNSDCVSEGV